MGCTSSKQARHGHRGSPPPAPYLRSYSMPICNRGMFGRVGGSGRHVVALTSSTLGSIKIDSKTSNTISDDSEIMMKSANDDSRKDMKDIVNKAKAWSEMIDSWMPKMVTKTCTDVPEIIDARELMAGLEDAVDTALVSSLFSFNSVNIASPKPIWMQITPGDSIISDFDPDIISNFRKALEQLSPQHQLLLRSPEQERAKFLTLPPLREKSVTKPVQEQNDIPMFTGIVKARISAFQEKINAKKGKKCPPNGERKVVYYFTSLRGVRKTYEDCWAVKVILQGYRVKVDERDLSMHEGFKDELNEVLGVGFGGSQLPRVFANGTYLGGAEKLRQMHEDGVLGKSLEECEAVMGGDQGGICEACGDMRFAPCGACSGSCKVFAEDEGEEEGVIVSGFRRCTDCNKNGLVRCPICC